VFGHGDVGGQGAGLAEAGDAPETANPEASTTVAVSFDSGSPSALTASASSFTSSAEASP